MRALAKAECLELGVDIDIGFACEVRRILDHRNAVNAVTGRARFRRPRRVGGQGSCCGVGRIPGRDIGDLLIAQHFGDDRHHFMRSCAVPERCELIADIGCLFAAYMRRDRNFGITVYPVAGSALPGNFLAGGGVALNSVLGERSPGEQQPAETKSNQRSHLS